MVTGQDWTGKLTQLRAAKQRVEQGFRAKLTGLEAAVRDVRAVERHVSLRYCT